MVTNHNAGSAVAAVLYSSYLVEGLDQRIGIKIEPNANLYVVGIATFLRIPRHAFVCIPPPKKSLFLVIYVCRGRGSVSLCHRGGRMENINAWYLNTHMVYL